jgi:PilZ domain
MERRVRLPKSANRERRASTRFPLTMDLRYTIPGCHGPAEMGSAHTVDVSSSGLSFTSDKPLLVGQRLEVSLDWPVLLDGYIKLQLVLSGVVVRRDGLMIALEIRQHDFRTHRERH